jgi:peptide deformylase
MMIDPGNLEIVHYPHPALRWKSKPLKRVDEQIRAAVRRMFELMYEAEGIGLAANQVALPYQLFVLNVTADPNQTDQEQVFLNPVIVKRSGSQEGEEGCLSLPTLYGPVRRAKRVEVVAFDLDGSELRVQAEDLPARAIQHEIDHLEGTLFIDRMTELARRELEAQLEDFRRRFQRRQGLGEEARDEEIEGRLVELEAHRT